MPYILTETGRKLSPNASFTLNEEQFPSTWLKAASPEDLASRGISLEPDPILNFKNENWYYNSVQDGVVISTPKDLDKLKEQEISRVKKAARAKLAKSDWMVLRAVDGTPIPEDWQSHRLAVRLTSNEAEAAIEAADFEGIQSLKVEWPESPEAKARREAEEEAARLEREARDA